MSEASMEGLERMAQVLRMLAHPQRLRVIGVLEREGEAPVHVLAEALGVSQSVVSHHLGRLKQVKLVGSERRGKEVWYRVVDARALTILECIGKTGAGT